MPKPIIHGFDHGLGGADPVPGIGDGIQFGGDNRVYGADNQGGYLSITTNEQEGVSGLGFFLTDESAGGIVIDSGTGGDFNLAVANGGDLNITNTGAGDIDIAASVNISVQATAELDLKTVVGAVMVEAGGPARHHAINDGDAHVVAAAVARLESQGGHDSVPGGVNIQSLGGAGIEINAKSTSGAGFPAGGTRPIVISSSGSEGGSTGPTVLVGIAAGDRFTIFRNDTFAEMFLVSTTGVSMTTLGTTNPGGSGKLWNNSGVVNIT